jgi:hypothetical protein
MNPALQRIITGKTNTRTETMP